MAKFLRCASFLRRSLLLETQESRRGLLEASVLLRHFSTKRTKKSKSDASDSNMSKKDLELKLAMDEIITSFGKGSIMWLGRSDFPKTPVVSTGSFALDIALGIGGLPKGRFVEMYGPVDSGITTLALHVIAEAQKQGGSCAFIDAERVFDPSLAEAVGVKTESLLLQQPAYGEQALTMVETLIRDGSVNVIVVDSIAALVPEHILDGEKGDEHMTMQGLMSQALRKLTHSLSVKRATLIFTNQIRGTSDSEVTCAGNALKYYASVRLRVTRTGLLKRGDETIGTQVAVKIVKNKLAPPFKEVKLVLESGKGISQERELIDLGCRFNLITECNSFLTMNDITHQSKDDLKRYLSQNKSAREELKEKLRDKLLNEVNHKDDITTDDDAVSVAEA